MFCLFPVCCHHYPGRGLRHLGLLRDGVNSPSICSPDGDRKWGGGGGSGVRGSHRGRDGAAPDKVSGQEMRRQRIQGQLLGSAFSVGHELEKERGGEMSPSFSVDNFAARYIYIFAAVAYTISHWN